MATKGRPANPACVGMSVKEKRAYQAKQFQDNNREHYREYQREYHRKYDRSPYLVIPRLDKLIAELEQKLAVEQARHAKRIAPLVDKMVMAQTERDALQKSIDDGTCTHKPRNKEQSNGN